MIHHVTREIAPERLDACIAFYAILGFKPVPVPDGIAGRAVWLQSDDAPQQESDDAPQQESDDAPQQESDDAPQQVHLMPVADARPATGHFALVCPDYDATVKSLRESGAEVEPRREHWGSPRAYVRDPAGNLVELMAWPPGGARE